MAVQDSVPSPFGCASSPKIPSAPPPSHFTHPLLPPCSPPYSPTLLLHPPPIATHTGCDCPSAPSHYKHTLLPPHTHTGCDCPSAPSHYKHTLHPPPPTQGVIVPPLPPITNTPCSPPTPTQGVIVPPLPEKSTVQKFQMGTEFLEQRRRALEVRGGACMCGG